MWWDGLLCGVEFGVAEMLGAEVEEDSIGSGLLDTLYVCT